MERQKYGGRMYNRWNGGRMQKYGGMYNRCTIIYGGRMYNRWNGRNTEGGCTIDGTAGNTEGGCTLDGTAEIRREDVQ